MLQNPLKALPKNERERLEKLTEPETRARSKGFQRIVGVDEAGRGPLAGPVVAAACSIQAGVVFAGINDSKLLTEQKRQALFKQLTEHEGVSFGIGIVEHTVIDEINILQASLEAMRIAVKQLPFIPDCLLIDGKHIFVEGIYSEPLIKGDSRSQLIAAASIIAKETRDELMRKYHEQYPEYGFGAHKGYGTKKHLKALAKYGPCPIHRRSFSPLAEEVH